MCILQAIVTTMKILKNNVRDRIENLLSDGVIVLTVSVVVLMEIGGIFEAIFVGMGKVRNS